jgi:tetratricopeptide (TPR) repeat protein
LDRVDAGVRIDAQAGRDAIVVNHFHGPDDADIERTFRRVLLSTGSATAPQLRSFLPESVLAAQEIPKPKNWQDFQRGCVVLFQAELKDPHAQEYGRQGQKQRGIDILARRNGIHDYFVGIQCRRYDKPLKKAAILKDCRAALAIKAGLKEIIFATTCPADTNATDAALEVERELRAEGHDLKVVLYSWADLELKIIQHPKAQAFFFPAAVALMTTQSVRLDAASITEIVEAVERKRLSNSAVVPADVKLPADSSEDPALHAKIDLLRDLFRKGNSFGIARDGLLELQSKEDLSSKPWARFRIETNLGSVAIRLGRQEEAAGHFEQAYAIRPTDCNAIGNLALARTIRGRYAEAMELAKVALGSKPRSDQAVSYLLQAAARSSWEGDPESLIPPDLVGSVHADLGLTEFWRKRNVPGWAEQTLAVAQNHPDVPELKLAAAIAVLELALGPDVFIGTPGAITRVQLENAAAEMSSMAENCLSNAFADKHDLLAFVNNAAVLLRLLGKQAECESILVRALPLLSDQPQLRRLLALSQVAQDRFDDAAETLRADSDPESRLLFAETVARKDEQQAIKLVEEIDATEQGHIAQLKWRVLGDLALRSRDYERVNTAIAHLVELPQGKLPGALLRLQRDARLGVDENERHAQLIELGGADSTLANNLSRYLVAEEMRNQGLPAEAAKLLEPIVDPQALNPATRLYLGCLVEARRDEAFRAALKKASTAVNRDLDTLWLVAIHSWNVGDLPDSRKALDTILANRPDNAPARLLKIEILIRSNDTEGLLKELERPIEQLPFSRLRDKLRIASLLGYFGQMERAVAYAYRLFLENRQASQAWLCFQGLILRGGTNLTPSDRAWDIEAVEANAAVDIEYDDGEKQFVIVEPDATLRGLDEDSWEPDHPLIREIMGSSVGAKFVNPVTGKTGEIKQIRHKYVAKYHFVLANHETRFPEVSAFRSFSIDPSSPDGLAPILEQLKARHDFALQEQENYQKGPWPLAIFAHRVGCDTIEVADGLAAQELQMKVATGSEAERHAAIAAISSNRTAGCVLDLLSYWTYWRLGALDAVIETCGTVHIAQSTMDQLLARRERIAESAQAGLKSARYDNGKMSIIEVGSDVAQAWLADIEGAIKWAGDNAVICPLIVPDKIPDALREFLRENQLELFDSLIVAMYSGILLVTDDAPTREFGRRFGFGLSAWSQPVFMVASNRKKIDFDTYVKWTAHLIGAGHNYVCVSGVALLRAAAIDAQTGECPGYLFKQTARMIGGVGAEPASHIRVVVEFIRYVWNVPGLLKYRERTTGYLLGQLVRDRTADYRPILREVLRRCWTQADVAAYITVWLRGHFIDLSA